MVRLHDLRGLSQLKLLYDSIFTEERFGATARFKQDDQTLLELNPSLNAEKAELCLLNVNYVY